MSLSPPDILDTFVETQSTLSDYDYLKHVVSRTDRNGNTFGDYWQMQAIGATESLYPDQTNIAIPDLLRLIPESPSLAMFATSTLVLLAWTGFAHRGE